MKQEYPGQGVSGQGGGDAAIRDDARASSGARNGAIELLRFAAAIGIVHFHLGMPYGRISVTALPFFMVLLVYFGVNRPLETVGRRLLLPWVFWSGFYGVALCLNAFLGSSSVIDVFQPWMLFTGPALHLWFLPFSFLFLALLAFTPDRLRAPLLVGTTGIAIVLKWTVGMPTPFAQWASIWPVAAVGYAMAVSATPLRICALSSIALALVLVWHFDIELFRCVLALVIMGLALCIPWRAPGWVGQLSRLSFGIYLLHPLVIGVVVRIDGLTQGMTFLATVLLTMGLVIALLRTPLARFL